MDLHQDHFSLFGLAPGFGIDAALLEQRYRALQAEVHPDRHVHLDAAGQRRAMQHSTQVNEAYQTLKQPLRRAEYLLQLAGVDVHAERSMAAEFLMQQMSWREAVAEARAAQDEDALDDLLRRIRELIRHAYQQLASALDAQDWAAAAQLTRQLMFEEKLLREVDDALAALDDA